MFPSRKSQVGLHRLIIQTSPCHIILTVSASLCCSCGWKSCNFQIAPWSWCATASASEQLSPLGQSGATFKRHILVLVFKPAVYSVTSLRWHTPLLLEDYKRWKLPACWFPGWLSTSDNDIFSAGISAGCEESPEAVCVCKDLCVPCVSRSPLC